MRPPALITLIRRVSTISLARIACSAAERRVVPAPMSRPRASAFVSIGSIRVTT